MAKTVLVGAVAYDPKVVSIWEIIKKYFVENGCDIDYVFYSNYEQLVTALLNDQIDIAWNSPLAWVDAQHRSGSQCRAIAMRDTDRDRVTHIVVKADSGINALQDLRGKTLATGAKDSPQATLIPIRLMQDAGLEPGRDFFVKRFDVLVGKHGDHVGGERDALQCLMDGNADATCVLDLNWGLWSSDGTADPAKYKILATTPPFDHCVFTVRDGFDSSTESDWLKVLHSMSYDNPEHKEMMDMEGLKEWQEGRTTGFWQLEDAVTRQGFFK
ncbi:MAG: PhnD/SsuA/transferrin family substrate-binding protein [Fimbriimonadaceae bacterium]|nr:PhnD/SsuA/transferrin family substrate-binding protein [Fimbriimonadaceae bacterium]